ncbi:MAG TPA: hypothetical protein DET40_12955 [Lentisphaeria bacterium]|nr:MAG: hypothetical protein A2X45_19120 [Lentisphaerae bacterium GWF2_50_93]HCE44450.1 hypothetical protein [Lentisphaeria bacterium]
MRKTDATMTRSFGKLLINKPSALPAHKSAAHVDIGQQGNFNIESGDKGLVFCIYIVLLYSQILI